jgi:hypothetical protein
MANIQGQNPSNSRLKLAGMLDSAVRRAVLTAPFSM